MDFYVLTLFPDMIEQGVGTSITGRAIKNHTIGLHTINIRDFTADKHRRVDDYTYGGGAGMLMQPQPVYDAWQKARENIPSGRKVRTIYVTPQGQPFTQKLAQKFAENDDLIFLCGHYEGIDERVLEETVTDYVSIGDYVLTGGELAAMVMIDAISRLVPGVLHNDISAETESFHGSLLEYPQYSRPEEWHGKRVPEVLLSGNQKQIDAWRLAQQEIRTRERRPDLYREYQILQNAKKILMKNKIHCMDMIAKINCGHAEILAVSGKTGKFLLIKEDLSGEYFISNPDGEQIELRNAFSAIVDTAARMKAEEILITLHEEADAEEFRNFMAGKSTKNPKQPEGFLHMTMQQSEGCTPRIMQQPEGFTLRILQQSVLTRREKLPVTGLYRPDGKPSPSGLMIRPSALDKGRMEAWKNEICVGSITEGPDGRMQGLFVEPEYRRQHIAMALETCLCNRLLEQGMTPWCQYEKDEIIESLQKKLGLYTATAPVYTLKIRVRNDNA